MKRLPQEIFRQPPATVMSSSPATTTSQQFVAPVAVSGCEPQVTSLAPGSEEFFQIDRRVSIACTFKQRKI
jgi:hypothetical protein